MWMRVRAISLMKMKWPGLIARNLSKYFKASRNERNFSLRPNSNQNRGCSFNPKVNQPFTKQTGNTGNNNRAVNDDSKKDKCFECHGLGHHAFEASFGSSFGNGMGILHSRNASFLALPCLVRTGIGTE